MVNRLREWRICSILLLVCMVLWNSHLTDSVKAADGVYYVSPTGSDTNDGSLSSPFKTLQKARDVVRTQNSNMSSDITIYLRGGQYELDNPFVLGKDDSGTNGHHIIYKAYNNEQPIITGGKQITGWQQTTLNNKQVYKANVSGIDNFRELYINDTRATRANSVNGVDLKANGIVSQLSAVYPYTANSYYTDNGVKAGYIINKALFGNDLRNNDDFELVYRKNWRQHRIAADQVIDNGNNTLTFKVDPVRMGWALTMDYAAGQPNTSNPFYVENAIGLLDYPGEWYYDKTAKEVYYYPKTGENMSTAEVYVPTGVETLLKIEGDDLAHRVSNITFEGITFEYSAWLRPFTLGTALVQANFYVTANGQGSHTDGTNGTETTNGGQQAESAIDVSFAEDLVFKNNTIRHTGGTGLRLYNGVNNVAITENTIYDISETGILLGTWLHNFIDKNDEGVVKDVLIRNNTLNGLGREYYSSPSIAAYYTDSVTIEHNEILHSAYGCINYGWNGWQGNTQEGISGEMDSITSRNTIIRYNKFIEYSEYMGDVGGTYSLGQQPNTEIYGNYYKNGNNYNGIIYYDEGTAYVNGYNNVVDQGIRPDHGISWHCSWTPSIHDYYLYNNYSNWTDSNIKGTRAVISNNHFDKNVGQGNGGWPAAAQAIIDHAGVTTDPYVPAKSQSQGDAAFNTNAKWLHTNLQLDHSTADVMAQNAVDGNPNTVARAGTSNAMGILEIDMLKPSYINKSIITFDTANFPTAYNIQASLGGIAYQEVADVTNNTQAVSETLFSTIEARFIRIVPVALNSTSMMINNISMFQDAQAVPIAPATPYTQNPLQKDLVMWINGDSAVYAGNNRVSSWNDLKGSHHLRVPTAVCTLDSFANGDTNTRKKPQLRAKVIDKRPVLNFDGWDDSLTTSLTGDKQNNTIVYFAQAKAADGLQFFLDTNQQAISPNQKVIPGEWALWVFSTTNGVTTVYKNGQQLYTQQAASGSFSSLSISANRPIRYSGTDVKVTNANVAELMTYSRGLTKDEVNGLSTYIYNKYASVKPCTVSFTNTNSVSMKVTIKMSDGSMVDADSSNTIPLPVGDYTCYASSQGFLTEAVNFTVSEADVTNQTKSVQVTLSPACTLSFTTNQGTAASDLVVAIEGQNADVNGVFNIPPGTYNYSASSIGFNNATGTFDILQSDVANKIKTITIQLTPKPVPETMVDDTDSNIVYKMSGSFAQDQSVNSSSPCYNNTRHHNYGVIGQGAVTVNKSIITYTFKGTGIAMYNEVEAGVTHIEVNLYKGNDTTGEQIDLNTSDSTIQYAIANQRTLENGNPAGSQAGNQKTFEKTGLSYGWYTIEIKPSIADIQANNMNGFITLDAFKVLDSRPQPTTPKAHWQYENNSNDSGSGSYNGTIHGNAAYVTSSKIGTYALQLDGNGDYMSSGLVTTAVDNVTLSLWVKPSSVAGIQILAHNGNTGTTGYGLLNNNNKVAILIGGKAFCQSSEGLTVGQWHHLAAVRRNGTWELHINRVQKIITNNTIAPNVPDTGTYIGANHTGTENYNGSVDDVQFYERALTLAEITNLATP